MHIIENKKSDAMTVKQKTGAWQQVMINFNAAGLIQIQKQTSKTSQPTSLIQIRKQTSR